MAQFALASAAAWHISSYFIIVGLPPELLQREIYTSGGAETPAVSKLCAAAKV